jgi:hypothetical protein
VGGTEARSTERRSTGQVTERTEDVQSPIHQIEGEPARVRVGGSATINMGDYNSIRCEVMIERPCVNDEAAIDATYASVSQKVEELLQAELDAATGQDSNSDPF